MSVVSFDVNAFIDLMYTDPERYKYQNLLLNMIVGVEIQHLTGDERQLIKKYADADSGLVQEILQLERNEADLITMQNDVDELLKYRVARFNCRKKIDG